MSKPSARNGPQSDVEGFFGSILDTAGDTSLGFCGQLVLGVRGLVPDAPTNVLVAPPQG